MYYGKNVAIYRYNSTGPKRSIEANISKKAIALSGDKSFWPTFSRIIECDKPQGTLYL